MDRVLAEILGRNIRRRTAFVFFFLDLLGVINIIFISPANLGTLYCSTLIYYVELVKIALRYMVDQFDNA